MHTIQTGDSSSAPDELVISYLKSEYTGAPDSAQDEYIEDVLNPTARLTYRRYNLKTNQFHQVFGRRQEQDSQLN
ncbi:MAG: hypothetical protein LBP35_02850 [Candidatus Ancillula trichonymphae]|nr:hypothetical protein [Candidatus Ancillula trichonymphae]